MVKGYRNRTVGVSQLAVCAVGVLRGWRFARLAVCGERFKVGVLRLELSSCSFSE